MVYQPDTRYDPTEPGSDGDNFDRPILVYSEIPQSEFASFVSCFPGRPVWLE